MLFSVIKLIAFYQKTFYDLHLLIKTGIKDKKIMATIESLKSSWQNDSFYMQTASKNAAKIFKAGAIGCLAGRITGAISPRDGAIFLAANTASDIFINFIENRFVKEPLMSDADRDLEKVLRTFARLAVLLPLNSRMHSLVGTRGLEIFTWKGMNKATVEFLCVTFAIDFVIKKCLKNFSLL